jgi:hypothetical protein
MLNTNPVQTEPGDAEETSVHRIVHSGAIGAVALAGCATMIVVALWFAFYLLVFLPRAGAP